MPLRNLSTLADALGMPKADEAEPPAESKPKRPRVGRSRHSIGNDSDDEDDGVPSSPTPSDPDLPSDLWAIHVMPFLPYIDMIRCTAVNRAFLGDVIPHVKEIEVQTSREMRAGPARRFRGVETVRIGCIYSHSGERHDEDDEDSDLVVEHGAVGLVAPFLPFFPALKFAQVGMYDPEFRDYGALESAHRRTDESDRLMQTLQTSICGAYRAGTISSNVEVIGADAPCPNYHSDEEDHTTPCAHCIDYCQSYPMKIVADTSHCKAFPVCLPIGEVVNIILRRPGGKEYLTSPEYFIRKHIDLAVRDSALVEVLREMNLMPAKITRRDVEQILSNEKGYSIAHTCNEQEYRFFHESGITCLLRSDFRSVRPVAPSDTRGIWW